VNLGVQRSAPAKNWPCKTLWQKLGNVFFGGVGAQPGKDEQQMGQYIATFLWLPSSN